MMRALFVLSVLWLTAAAAAGADEQQVEQFDGHNSLTTSDFTVPDHWEIRWHSDQALSIGVIRLDNTVVAGATGKTNGSLYLPKGGTFRICVKGQDPIPWDVVVVALGPHPAEADEPPDVASTPDSPVFYVPTAGPDEATNAAPEEENSTPPPATNAAPVTEAPPAPAPPPPVPTRLTPEKERAIVQVKGDRAKGLGFITQTPAGPVVVTALSLIANNPHLDMATVTGEEIRAVSIRGAIDRGLAMIGIQDNSYAKLPMATDFSTVQTGDPVLTSANGLVAAPTSAQVVAIAPLRIDLGAFDNHGDPGGPILDAKTGQVIGVVDSGPQTSITTDLDKTPFPTREMAVANSVGFFGWRLDDVANWETYDERRLATETFFLDAFHQRSRALDSYLNSQKNDLRANAKLYLNDDKIKAANDTYVQSSAGGDSSQRMESLRALLFELGTVADTDMDQIQEPANFYTFERQRAQDEINYRKALKGELDYYSSNVTRFGVVVDRNNQAQAGGD